MKIIDLIMWSGFHETDMLNLRLNTLKDVVDYHIILDSHFSHSRIFKGLSFDPNNFPDFQRKIICYDRDFISSENPHLNEQAARNSLLDKANDISNDDEDVFLAGDLDEIADPEVLKDLIKKGLNNKLYTLTGKYFHFCLDLYGRPDFGAVVITRGMTRGNNLQQFRQHRTNYEHKDVFIQVPDSSFHYSSCFSLEKIILKYNYYCHAPEVDPRHKDPNYLREFIKGRSDGVLKLIEMKYPNCPKYLEQNLHKYKQYLYSNYI